MSWSFQLSFSVAADQIQDQSRVTGLKNSEEELLPNTWHSHNLTRPFPLENQIQIRAQGRDSNKERGCCPEVAGEFARTRMHASAAASTPVSSQARDDHYSREVLVDRSGLRSFLMTELTALAVTRGDGLERFNRLAIHGGAGVCLLACR